MTYIKYPDEQHEPPLPAEEMLPTMYDLPSEDPSEPGVPDEFHILQPQLLSATCRPRLYWPNRMFTASDLNLYYDVHYQLWYKRPDWFVVVDIPRLYRNRDLRLSYLIWQEGRSPHVVVELLSPGTEAEDLGQKPGKDSDNSQQSPTPPSKWEVYERILRVPYYVVFSRYTNRLQVFKQIGGHYQEQNLDPNNPRIWMSELELGLGLWQGEYDGIDRLWLRWYDSEGNWIPTQAEEALIREQKALAREQQIRVKADRLADRLRELGIDPDTV